MTRATSNVMRKAKLILAFELTAGSRYAFLENTPYLLLPDLDEECELLLPLL